jgi:hypothetical protein
MLIRTARLEELPLLAHFESPLEKLFVLIISHSTFLRRGILSV